MESIKYNSFHLWTPNAKIRKWKYFWGLNSVFTTMFKSKLWEKVQSIWKKAHKTTQVVNYFKKMDMGLCQTNKARAFLKPFTYAFPQEEMIRQN